MAGLSSKKESKWVPKDVIPTRLERKHLRAAYVFVEVLAFLTHHTYQFRGQRYLQLKDGPIGERGTACIAKARMAMWSRQIKQVLRRNAVK